MNDVITIHRCEVRVVRGSLLKQDVDVLVNAANRAMRGGGGIDGALHAAAGPGMLRELARAAPNGAPTAAPVHTAGHNLLQPHVLHVAGPVWQGGGAGEPELLSDCYRAAMQAAHGLGVGSVGFCSISTGVYGYPLHLAAPLALRTVAEFLRSHPETPITRVIFAMFGAHEYDVFTGAVADLSAEA